MKVKNLMFDLFSSIWANYIPISIIAIGISVALLAIIYQLGKILSDKKMSEWAKYELYQAIGSIVMIAVIFFVLSSINTVLLISIEKGHEGQSDSGIGFQCSGGTCSFNEYAIPSGKFTAPKPVKIECTDNCHIELAKSYLNSTFDVIRYYTASQLCMAGWITLSSEFSMNFAPLRSVSFINQLRVLNKFTKYLPIKSFAPFAGCGLVDQSYETMVALMTDLLGVIKGNWMMLNLVEYAIFPLFLVWGIILRSISLTRKLGGLLIAMALVLYFFYPSVIILQGVLLSPQEQLLQLEGGCPGMGSILDKDSGAGSIFGTNTSQGWEPKTNIFLSVQDDKGNKFPVCPFMGFTAVGEDGIMSMTAAITVWVTVQFIILVYLVAMMITEISPLFGGDVDIAGISRLL